MDVRTCEVAHRPYQRSLKYGTHYVVLVGCIHLYRSSCETRKPKLGAMELNMTYLTKHQVCKHVVGAKVEECGKVKLHRDIIQSPPGHCILCLQHTIEIVRIPLQIRGISNQLENKIRRGLYMQASPVIANETVHSKPDVCLHTVSPQPRQTLLRSAAESDGGNP
jgi:hypothetical protein